jgi:ABC-type glutathione transport system ATPase component
VAATLSIPGRKGTMIETEEPEVLKAQAPEQAIVTARRVRKVFRSGTEVEALRGVDFEVGRGEMVAVVGPSGSGKTTLLNCL